ncbi:MAG: 2-aminoethylphosphonate--pyruvate transaminase [Bacteroidetes bacterium]|nr:MAG: 2-aminoethylphosphonate--pyruvate transaminase [Bacteroidota bacterium]
METKNEIIERNNAKLLFTPGPLTTSDTVKSAALKDMGSRDEQFIILVKDIRNTLLQLAHVSQPEYQCVLMQGSGTFGIEAVISSAIPRNGMLLNIINGAYGRRISQMSHIHNIPTLDLHYHENQLPILGEIEKALVDIPQITHMALVHGETTTGLINPVEEIGLLAKKHNKTYIVDAMSTFGAYKIDVEKLNIGFLISSSNKCIEGIPGFSFVIAREQDLQSCENQARTLSLDLYSQWLGLEKNGQFRFTPPVQALMAFHSALYELIEEGGTRARGKRYAQNNEVLVNQMRKAGFRLYLDDAIRGYIITAFLYPEDPAFSFEDFYQKLNDRGFVIYPGKLGRTQCFRLGNIGQLFPEDMNNLVVAIHEVIAEIGVKL